MRWCVCLFKQETAYEVRSGDWSSDVCSSDLTNGKTQDVGTLVLANFNNLQGLKPVGGNAWAETSESGQPILGQPGSNSLATIKGQPVAESNVDMTQDQVIMIISQRHYQTNAQTMQTQDQLLQTMLTMTSDKTPSELQLVIRRSSYDLFSTNKN